jgi:hypothetical protein
MNITFKNTNEVNFNTIHSGDTFIDQEYDEGTILMRVKTVCDVVLGTDTDITDNFDGYAVDIQTGEIMGYYNDTKVIPVKAEVTVKI